MIPHIITPRRIGRDYMKKWKVYLTSILLTFLVGGVSGLISRGAMQEYAGLVKPMLSPPAWIFPVVWTILYILMGIGVARVYIKTEEVPTIYIAQLFFNFMWSIIFFNFGAYLFAFIWLIALIILVIIMTVRFYRVDKLAGLIQIPYILWLLFAGYLNFMVYMLNR